MNKRKTGREVQRMNRVMEVKYYPKVLAALKTKVSKLVAVLKSGGYSAGVRFLHSDIGNEALAKRIEKLYAFVGMAHARRTNRWLREQLQSKSMNYYYQTKGLASDWLTFILNYLSRHLIEKITFDVDFTTKNKLLKVLEEAETEGWGIDKTVAALDDLSFTRNQAARIVRTEVKRAGEVGSKAASETLQYEQVKEWISVTDFRVRGRNPEDHADHLRLDGTVINADERFKDPRSGDLLMFPGDPEASAGSTINCFLGGTLVEGQFVGGQRLKYSGKLFEIITSSGKRLSITPNHPVFTNRGTVPAHRLTDRDYLLTNIKEANNIPLASIDDYIQQKPIIAANVFRTLNNSFASEKTMTVGLDFNGDAEFGDGYVDIVDMNRELEFSNEMLIEDIGKLSLKATHLERVLISRYRSFNKFRLRSLTAPYSVMGSDDLFFPFTRDHERPFKFFSIGTATNWNASRFETIVEYGTSDASFIRKLFHGNTGKIAFDKISKIRQYDFTGHVYDFSTLSGAILANNIYISNCRCTVAYTVKLDEKGRPIPKRGISVIRPQEINRTRTIITV